MAEREFVGVNAVVIHEQWGAPMSFHRLTRVEVDLSGGQTYLSFASYYNKAVAETGGMPMSNKTLKTQTAELADERTLLQTAIDTPNSFLADGVVEGSDNPVDEGTPEEGAE